MTIRWSDNLSVWRVDDNVKTNESDLQNIAQNDLKIPFLIDELKLTFSCDNELITHYMKVFKARKSNEFFSLLLTLTQTKLIKNVEN